MIEQNEFMLKPKPRGYHLVTPEIIGFLPKLPQTGLLHLHLKHTSAALSLNENADASVRYDFESFINKMVPESDACYTHVFEGPDDMPAHIKSSLFGAQLTIPITNFKLNLGTWQGIYLCEFRDYGGSRSLVATIFY